MPATRAGLSLLLGLLALLVVLGAASCAPAPSTPSPVTEGRGMAANPDVDFVIPAGTQAALERDEPAFQFPDVIHLQSGQAVSITNHDYAMHYFFDLPIAPGQTVRKVFPRAGVFVYQGGESCSIGHGSTIWVHVEQS